MKRILIIEDSAEFREYIAEILRLSGFVLAEAPDAAHALQLAHQAHPDLIVCDLHLPDVDGFAGISFPIWRSAAALIGLALLIYGLIWDAE